MLRNARIGNPPCIINSLADFGEALVGFERITSSGHKIENTIKNFSRKVRIGGRALNLSIKLIGVERLGAGHAQHMLRQHIKRTIDQRRRILRAKIVGVERCTAFHHFETIGRHQNGATWLIHTVVGATDTLRKAACPLWRTNMNDQIDIAPVDTKIKRRGGNHSS